MREGFACTSTNRRKGDFRIVLWLAAPVLTNERMFCMKSNQSKKENTKNVSLLSDQWGEVLRSYCTWNPTNKRGRYTDCSIYCSRARYWALRGRFAWNQTNQSRGYPDSLMARGPRIDQWEKVLLVQSNQSEEGRKVFFFIHPMGMHVRHSFLTKEMQWKFSHLRGPAKYWRNNKKVYEYQNSIYEYTYLQNFSFPTVGALSAVVKLKLTTGISNDFHNVMFARKSNFTFTFYKGSASSI